MITYKKYMGLVTIFSFPNCGQPSRSKTSIIESFHPTQQGLSAHDPARFVLDNFLWFCRGGEVKQADSARKCLSFGGKL